MKNLIVSYLVFKHVISLAKNMLTICTYIASTALLPFNPCNSCSLRATQPANPSSYLLNSKDDQHQTKHTQQACCPGVWRFGVRLSTFALARPASCDPRACVGRCGSRPSAVAEREETRSERGAPIAGLVPRAPWVPGGSNHRSPEEMGQEPKRE